MLLFELAKLWTPGDTGYTGGFPQPQGALWLSENGSVTMPLCNQETAETTISTWTPPAIFAMSPYDTRLRCWMLTPYGRYLVHDGIVTEPELDTETDTIKIPATDHSLRMVNHYIRLGDRVLNKNNHPDFPNQYNKKVPLDGQGLRWIMEAARNLVGNQQDNYPPLGISDGFNEFPELDPPAQFASFTRSDEVWQSFLELVGNQGAPEFRILPRDGIAGIYASLYTSSKMGLHDPVNEIWIPDQTTATAYLDTGYAAGDDMPASHCDFQAGYGLSNCQIKHHPGGNLTSHVHTLASEGKLRVTVHNPSTGERYGVYVKWEQTDFKPVEDVLRYRGLQVLSVSQMPPDNLDIKLDGSCGFHFMEHFLTGSIVRASYKSGLVTDVVERARIMEVRLFDDPATPYGHRTEITVQPDLGTIDLEDEF